MSTIEKSLDTILEGTYTPLAFGDHFKYPSDEPSLNMNIMLTFDGDVHLVPELKRHMDKIEVNDFGHVTNGTEPLKFSINANSPIFNKGLFVLAEAIRRDNLSNGRNLTSKVRSVNTIQSACKHLTKNLHKFPSLTESVYERVHDDNDGDSTMTLKLEIKDDCIVVHMNDYNSLRFRESMGGGCNLRTRNALLYLAYLTQLK